MKQTLFKNLPYKILALIVAVPVWLILINIANPMSTKTISGIPIDVQHEKDEIELNGKTYVYDYAEEKSVALTVTARKKDIDEITSKDFYVWADMDYVIGQKDTEKGLKIEWKTVNHKNLFSEDAVKMKGDGLLKFKLEEVIERTLPVRVEWTGEFAEDITLENEKCQTSPSEIKLRDRRSVLGSIREARVTLDRTLVTSDTTEIGGKLQLFDGNGSMITDSTKPDYKEDVTVYVVPLKSKTINIKCDLPTESVAPGYKLSGCDPEPKTVKVIGLKATLAELNDVTIPSEELHVSNATSDMEFHVDLSKYLPENVRIADESSSDITVTVTVEKLKTRNFRISTDDLVMLNRSEELEYIFYNKNFVVTLQGFGDDLDAMSINDIIPEVDLSSYQASEELQSVPVNIRVSSDYTLVEPITLSMRVRVPEITSEEETESGSESGPEPDTGGASESESESEMEPETPSESESFGPVEPSSEPIEEPFAEPDKESAEEVSPEPWVG